MSVLSGPTGMVDLATRLSADLAAGVAPRQTYGARDAAFAWTDGLPNILARHVSSAVVDGLTFGAVHVTNSGTPATKVAKGGTKPTATAITQAPVALSKYTGLGVIQTEDVLSTEGLLAALGVTITNQVLLAYDTDCIAALAAGAGVTATAATWPAAILAGIGAVAAQGGQPSLLVLSAADYAAAVGSPGVGFALDPTTAVVTLFGLEVVISAAAVAKTAYVLSAASCMAAENGQSPVALVDPYSQSTTNAVRLIVEAFLGFVVAHPGSVCKVTYTGTLVTGAEAAE